jgi:micrococcal nuclease
MRRSPWIALLVVALALAGGAARWSGRDAGGAGGTGRSGEDVLAGGRTARVVRVVDGDTIKVRLDGAGATERVRYLGVDTPESVKPGTPVQCYAKAASHANERLVGGRRVRLEGDVEPRDRYGRLLAYVWVAGAGSDPRRSVNAALVRDGDAQTLTIPPNVRHAALFRELAAQARRAGRGLWATCGGE